MKICLLFLALSSLLIVKSSLASSLTCSQSSSGLAASISYQPGPVSELKFRFSAARGYESIPQIEGPVAARDMPVMQWQFKSLKELGSSFEVVFPESVCKLDRRSEGVFQCFLDVPIAGTGLTASSLTAFTALQSHVSGDFELQNFRLLIGTTDVFFFSVSFPKTSCFGKL
jgi:hypothetical protein